MREPSLNKQSILDHFGVDFSPFYSRYLRDLKRDKAVDAPSARVEV
jgi:hypothetical protein